MLPRAQDIVEGNVCMSNMIRTCLESPAHPTSFHTYQTSILDHHNSCLLNLATLGHIAVVLGRVPLCHYAMFEQ